MKNNVLNTNALNTEILIMQGGAIKALGKSEDGKTGRVGGILCRFTTADDTDGYGDYFDGATDFRFVEGMKSPIYFDHGLNELLGVKCLGEGVLSLEEEGIAIEGEVDLTDTDNAAIYARVEDGDLGWSSGTAGHLVKRTQVKSYGVHGESAWHIDHWPLGLDASLTPHPAEPRNVATVKSLKSRMETDAEVERAVTPAPEVDHAAELAEVKREVIRLRLEILRA